MSANVSLGYDVPRVKISELLLEAASRAGLEEPFVQVLELGDFSVTYRIAGLLEEVKQIVTARSRLRGCVMDALQEGKVEIVSPTFMNTRALADAKRFVPRTRKGSTAEYLDGSPESVLFDEAESLESLKTSRKTLVEQITALRKQSENDKDDPANGDITAEMERLMRRLERLDKVIAGREANVRDQE